jgi:glutathione-regulated potassium-efflux system ancillary protein KefG
MGRKVDVDDLIDTQAVAELLALAHRNTVSEYQARYDDMPRPVVDLGRGRSKLWLRSEIEPWSATHRDRAGGRGRGRRRSAGQL